MRSMYSSTRWARRHFTTSAFHGWNTQVQNAIMPHLPWPEGMRTHGAFLPNVRWIRRLPSMSDCNCCRQLTQRQKRGVGSEGKWLPRTLSTSAMLSKADLGNSLSERPLTRLTLKTNLSNPTANLRLNLLFIYASFWPLTFKKENIVCFK